MQLTADAAKLLTLAGFAPCCTTFAMLPTVELLEVLWATNIKKRTFKRTEYF